jgi:hypothetical protein
MIGLRWQKKMLNAKCSMQNAKWIALCILHLSFCILHSAPHSCQAAPTTDTESQSAAASEGRYVYELSRLRQFDDGRLPMALAVAGAIALVAIVWYLYRRDTVELARPLGFGIALLRMVAIAGLFVFFLGIERRTTREVVHNSQVAVLVDTSQSMGLSDNEQAASPTTRIAEVVAALGNSPLIADLQKTHDVNVSRFDEEVTPVVTAPKESSRQENQSGADADILSKNESATQPRSAQDEGRSTVEGPGEANVPGTIDWSAELQPRGAETRLGQALSEQLRLYQGAPLAGIIVISDGAQNAGVEPSAAAEAAKAATVPIYTVGIGSTEVRRNIALRDLLVPARAFPGDTLNVTGYVQANGYAG